MELLIGQEAGREPCSPARSTYDASAPTTCSCVTLPVCLTSLGLSPHGERKGAQMLGPPCASAQQSLGLQTRNWNAWASGGSRGEVRALPTPPHLPNPGAHPCAQASAGLHCLRKQQVEPGQWVHLEQTPPGQPVVTSFCVVRKSF